MRYTYTKLIFYSCFQSEITNYKEAQYLLNMATPGLNTGSVPVQAGLWPGRRTGRSQRGAGPLVPPRPHKRHPRGPAPPVRLGAEGRFHKLFRRGSGVVWTRSLLPQDVPRQGRKSLAMSSAEAGDVFLRARGRTLDAFSSGTAWLFAREGVLRGCGTFRAGNLRVTGHASRGTLLPVAHGTRGPL